MAVFIHTLSAGTRISLEALSFGSAPVAIAATPATGQSQESQKPDLSSWADQNIFNIGEHGSETDEIDGENLFDFSRDWKNVSDAGKRLYIFTAILGVTSVAALLIAPAYNFVKFGPFAQ